MKFTFNEQFDLKSSHGMNARLMSYVLETDAILIADIFFFLWADLEIVRHCTKPH